MAQTESTEHFDLAVTSSSTFAPTELRRSGRVIKLERIPMEVLLRLVEQEGQLVTKEQIAERIWGKEVFLDIDNSINGAIRKVRQALQDDPEKPHVIQTVTGKGYRFIAAVVERDAADVSRSSFLVTRSASPEEKREAKEEEVAGEPYTAGG